MNRDAGSGTFRAAWIAGLAVLLGLHFPPATLAAGNEAAEETRSLRQLRGDLRTAERRFLSLYDRLNRDSGQEMVCDDAATTGTRFTKRSCTTRASQAATSEVVQDYINTMNLEAAEVRQSAAMEAIETGGPQAAAPIVTERNVARLAAVDLSPQQVAYRENLAQLVAEHPELGERLQEYATARRRLEAAEQAAR